MQGERRKKRKAKVRKESVDTQEKDSCQLHDLDVDMGENKEELSFLPSAGEQFVWVA